MTDITAKRSFRERVRSVRLTLKREIEVYRSIYRDPRTPRGAKVLLGIAVGYLLLPFDLIPDFLPVIGHLDDAIIVPGLIALALRLVPDQVVSEHRKAAR
jgi:uncharacterized membrane protein YkvA (DUF1232 family)